MAKSNPPDLIVAPATPAGRGGVGIVRASGCPDAIAQLAKNLTGRRPGEAIQPRTAHLTTFKDGDGQAIDSGLLLYFPGPNSFTGDDVLELQGHGSPVVINLLLKRCLALGARLARPGEFSERAFLNGRIDLTQAEAIADLIDASTQSAAKSAMRSLQGKFSQEIGALSAELIELRTLTEATLDFPDEEIDFLKAANAFERLDRVDAHLESVLQRAQRGALLRNGLRVVLIGQPNVGKSSLLNQLAGDELAIVTPIAGTTRDAVTSVVQIHGIPLHVIDTAGLRETEDPVERIGIERTWREIERADLALLLMDAEHGPGPAEHAILEKLPRGLRCLTILNKIDLSNDTVGRSEITDRDGAPQITLRLSARNGQGIELLEKELLNIAHWQDDEDCFIARERHLDALRRAKTHLVQARNTIHYLELFAEELRLSHIALQEITGEYTPDDLLGRIFGTFCIGK